MAGCSRSGRHARKGDRKPARRFVVARRKEFENHDEAPQDSAGAHHQNEAGQHKHPNEQNCAGGGTKHEHREPGEGGRA